MQRNEVSINRTAPIKAVCKNHIRHRLRSNSAAPQRPNSKLAWKHVAELDLQLDQDSFELMQGQVMFSPLDPVEGGMRDAHPLCELGVQ